MSCFVTQILEPSDSRFWKMIRALEREKRSLEADGIGENPFRDVREVVSSFPMVELDISLAWSFEEAKKAMLNNSLISTDWFYLYGEQDPAGELYSIFGSTDERYICKIFEREIQGSFLGD